MRATSAAFQPVDPNEFLVHFVTVQFTHCSLQLAQVDAGTFFKDVTFAVLGLIAVVTIGWFVITKLRGWMHPEAQQSESFTLDDLRRLHKSGQLSDAEYARTREAMIGMVATREPAMPRADAMTAKQTAALEKLGKLGLSQHAQQTLREEITRAAPAAPIAPAATSGGPQTTASDAQFPFPPIAPSRAIRPVNPTNTAGAASAPSESVGPVTPPPQVRKPIEGSPQQIVSKTKPVRPPGLS